MKKLFFTLLAVVAGHIAFAQNIPPVEGFRLETPQDYRNADSAVVQVARYFLSIPLNQDSNTRLKAGVFLTQWLVGTPDFDFDPDKGALRYIKKDVDLMTVYYCCLSSFVIRYPSVKDPNTIMLNAAKQLVAYMNKPANHVTLTRQLKNMVDADEKGELKSFLKL
ncbi:MAG TPA: hypothetical protein VFE53_07480 [Mucilaginibacter sp.]|jgi:hypothetical protein|nr:hypothetical protein [Mucilaginibacter sp.]